uniref:Ribonuclease H-like domain-containing protein n=1 Tax=Tanacetum cinerariifolium TaxID=118510 RepID=A0A6L2L8V9_TANCI|nr:ribonuclease H-like domain-containing protein [Tanacetum cinerariifolium]
MTIGCCKVDGGGGGEVFSGGEMFGGSVVFSGDGVDNGVGGVVCGVACGVVCGVFVEEKGLIWSHGAERKDSFVNYDMTGNDKFVGVQVKVSISMMIVRVHEKDRWCGTRGKFVWWKGVRVTKASKRTKVGVRDTTILTQSSPPPPLQTDPQTHTEPTTPASPTPINSPQLNSPQSEPSNPPSPIQQPSPQLLDIPNQPPTEPPRTQRMVTRSQSGIVKPIDRLSLHTTSISPLPKSPFIALQNPHWNNAMHDEYNALVKNGTWILVPRPAGINLVRSMWLFKHKFHADGTLSRYKARLVANGSSQQLGIDCDETFSPVVKPATIRTVLSLAVSRKWPNHQLDVKNAFLNEDLSETVYMHQPPGFVDPRYPHHVCLLQKSLYGLKQAPRAWFQRFAGYATRVGFYHSHCDSSLFILRQGSQGYLCQQYAIELLARAHMTNCNPSRTPVDTDSKLGPEGVQDPTLYHSLAGGLQYLTFTRLDISYAVQHQRTKHIEIDIHFVCDLVTAGQVRVFHVPSRYQYADIFTKELPSTLFEDFRSSLSVRLPPARTARAYKSI